MWLRTQTNRPEETLVNLNTVSTISAAQEGDDCPAVLAVFPDGSRQMLTYFDGPAAERLAQRALIALWGEMQIGVKFIDMAEICEAALEESG